jgi:adenylate kinase
LKRRIILLGPPASGKGTQAEMIAAKYGIPAASTGAMLREERARGTALGREADRWTAAGRLFPDEMAMRVVSHWLEARGPESFLLDGFPRTLGQANAFDAVLSKMGVELDAVFHLDLSDDEIRARVASRITCAQCGASFSTVLHGVTDGDACPACGERLVRRPDDTMETLAERLAQHRLHTAPVVEFYRATGRLIEIDASAGRDAVFQKICESIEEAIPA